MSLGSDKIDQSKTLGSTVGKENDTLDHSNKDSSKDKRAYDQSPPPKGDTEKVDELKEIGTTAPSEMKPTQTINATNTNNGLTLAPNANKKAIQSIEAEKKTTDSDSVPNAQNIRKTDNPVAVHRETPSSLSTANNNTCSSGANSFSGSRRSESSMTDSRSNSNEQRRITSENLSKTNLYIRGLPPNTTDDDLYTMCAQFGDIVSTKAILDKVTGCCRGYGFVQYGAAPSAELAVVELTKGGIQAQMARIPYNHLPHSQRFPYHKGPNNHSHYQNNYQHHGGHSNHHASGHHNSMNQSHTQSSHNHINNNISDPTNLYLANLPLNMSEVELDTLLSGFGPVVSTRILRDERHNSRGVGFARMESRDKCQEIIEKLSGKSYKGSGEPLLVKFADDGNRKRHTYNHHSNNNNHHHHHQQQQQQQQQHQHIGNNTHHKVSPSDSENRWKDTSDRSDQNVNPSMYEHQRNPTHGDQISDMSMMGSMNYPRMQPTFPSAMAANAAYPSSLGPPTSTTQWLHPGSGQTWNVIPQHMMQPNNMGPSSQGSVPANFPHFGHMTQLASQMQGLHLGHPSGPPLGGYLPPQWSPVWPHPMSPPQQTQSQQMRLSAPIQTSATPAQQITQAQSETGVMYNMGNQEGSPLTASKQTNLGDTNKQIPAPL